MKSSVLIVGCGYLGRRAAEAWQTQGRQVLAVTRSAARADEFRTVGLEPVVADVTEPNSLLLPSVQTVLYAVGLDRTSGKSMRDVYVRGLENVLAALPRPERFVYVSSTSVYGQTEEEEVDETSATEPLEESGQIVLEAEAVLRQRLPEAIVLRFTGIYGPGRLLRRQTLLAGEPIVGDADKWLNLIHVEDGVAAVLAAAELGRPGAIYNVSDGQPVRRRDFYRHLAQLLGAPEPWFVAPPPGTPLPPHERANRRVSNARFRDELKVTLRYPDYTTGLAASLGG